MHGVIEASLRRVQDMKRNVGLDEISDGRLYDENDLVKADCGGCNGCSACCHGMGNSIVLDPYDILRMEEGTGQSVQQFLAQEQIELTVIDGIILPVMKMQENTQACVFLNEKERCRIHEFRPGICRLFPLGRFYEETVLSEDGTRKTESEGRNVAAGRRFAYFLQTGECPKEHKSKIKVKKWIDTPNLKQYEAYIGDWHDFLEEIRRIAEGKEEETIKNLNLAVLKTFYLKAYTSCETFYSEFYERIKMTKKLLAIPE